MGRRRNGEGSIFRRKDGRWIASLTDDVGRRRQVTADTPERARQKLTELLSQRDRGLLMPSSDLTVGEYLNRWLVDLAKPRLRPSSFATYQNDVRRIEPLIGRIKLAELKPATLQAAYGRLEASGLSPRSVGRVHTTVHRALRQAVQFEMVGRNVAEIARPPRVHRKEMRTLTSDEVRRLFEATANDRLHALWVVLATSGMRIGEALALDWSDVDLASGRIRIRRSLQRLPGQGFTFVEPKTNRGRRNVMVPSGTVAALRRHRTKLEVELGRRLSNQDLVFPSAKDRPLEQGFIYWSLQRALEAAGLPRVRVHDLRHTAASILLEHGVHPKIVQEMLGHSTIALTLDTYSHAIPSLQDQTARKMEALFLDSRDDRAIDS